MSQVYIPTMQSSTPGAATDQDYWVRKNPTSQDQLYGLANFSFPEPILTEAQAPPDEGTTAPFWKRFDTAKEPLSIHWKAKLGWEWQSAETSTWGLGIPLPIFAAPPDEFPILVGKVDYFPLLDFEARRRRGFTLAANSLEDSPGSWIEIIPADAYTIPVCQLLSEIQEHLLEDVNGGMFFSSGLWTVDEVLAYLNGRISRFLMETGILQVRTTQVAPAADTFYDLPGDLIDLRRVAWTSGSTTTPLPRTDSFTSDIWDESWESVGGTPQAHILVPERSLEIRVTPKAALDGTLDLVYVKNLPPVTNDCSIMPIPDEWVPFVKWGVLSDMLSKEGEANDPQRASYAEHRWDEGVALARLYMGVSL